ncbi:YcxB family protein [Candidatus Leptofilum sp.]|uniref:YcxB family protein n=1 Tax=Candidatus Leptofilum sp. TaxID=3241576 RepID=UPI003B5C5410
MEITTHHSRLEHLYLQLYLIPRSKAVWVMGFIIWATLFFPAYFSREQSGDVVCTFCTILTGFIVASIGTTLIMLALCLFGLVVSVFSVGYLPGVLGEHKFVLKEDGLFEATEANETLTKWKGIRSIKHYKKYLMIWIGTGFYSIPKKFFDSQEQYEAFGSQLYERWEANK